MVSEDKASPSSRRGRPTARIIFRRAAIDAGQPPAAYRTRLRWQLPGRPPARGGGFLRTAPQLDDLPFAAVIPGPDVTAHGPVLAVRMLGPLVVAVDDVLVEGWSSVRQRSLFGYLLTHRRPWAPRDVLMDVFWPGSSPVGARNSLNVAIHGLRRTLKTVTDAPVIVYADGGYRLHSDVRLWLDAEEFGRCTRIGRKHQRDGEHERAAEDYELAATLYRGDFLADCLYEEWTSGIRERLRLAHLDVLGRLSDLHFAAGRYAACADVCERIIERDSCREDAHRRLMRCYSRQGQSHLALIQYHACVQALARELEVGPDPATVDLYDRIRRHERV
jgi:DNA-binding SARP family transcriptional activator